MARICCRPLISTILVLFIALKINCILLLIDGNNGALDTSLLSQQSQNKNFTLANNQQQLNNEINIASVKPDDKTSSNLTAEKSNHEGVDLSGADRANMDAIASLTINDITTTATTTLTTSQNLSKKELTNHQSQSTVYVMPDEGETITFKCIEPTEKHWAVVAWILPNGKKIYLKNTSSLEKATTVEASTNANYNYIYYDSVITFTEYKMEIDSVKHGMDGIYTCILEYIADDTMIEANANNQSINNNGTIIRSSRIFFIPYIISHINFPQTIILSIGISLSFCILCLAILCRNCVSNRRNQYDVEELGVTGYGNYNGTNSLSSIDQFSVHTRRKNQTTWHSWNTEESIEDNAINSAEKQKYIGRTFSTIGFDEILSPCQENPEKSSIAILPQPTPAPPLKMFSIDDDDDDDCNSDKDERY